MESDVHERTGLLDRLAAMVSEERSSPVRPCTIVLTGAGGTGKTHLITRLSQRFTGGRALVRAATADATITGESGAVLRRLVPEWADAVDGPARTGTDPVRAIDPTVSALAAERPLLLLVDDAHLADGLTLAALRRLADSGPPGLAMVVARRSIPPRGPLTMLAGVPGVREIRLGPLRPHEQDDLVARRVDSVPGPSLSRTLRVAGGNPAMLDRIIDWLEFRGRLVTGPDGRVDARVTHGELVEICSRSVEAQLQLLDPDALQTVRLAAVWGRSVTAAEIGQARRQHPSEFVSSIDAAVGAGLLTWEGERIRFGADIAADVVRALIDPPLLRLLETAVGAVEGPDTAADAPGGDATAPILRVQSSLQIGARLPQPPPAVAPADLADPALLSDASAVTARATMLSDAGRMREAYEVTRAAAETTEDPADLVTLLFMMLTFAVIGARVDKAHAVLERMRRQPLPPESTDWLDEITLWLDAMSGRPPRADAIAALAAADDAPPGITGRRTARAIGMLTAGDCVGALQLLDDVIDANAAASGWMGAESPEAVAWPLCVTRFAYGPASTLTRAPASGVADTRLVNRWLGPFRQGVIAEAHFATGELDIASMLLDDALAEAARIGSGWMSAPVADRALIDVHRGHAGQALARLERWRHRGLPDRFGFRDIAFAAAEAHLASGDLDAVRRSTGRLWEDASRDGQVPWLLLRAPALARQARLCGDGALVRRIAAGTAELWCTADAPALRGHALLTRAIGEGDPGLAVLAAGAFQSVGDQIGELAAHEETACLTAAAGDAPTARAHAHRTLRLAERISSTATRRRLRSRMRDHGLALGQTGARGPVADAADRPDEAAGLLTPAEARVSRMVADGYTGPQIAQQLGVSPRTVQTHVSHALRKLGLRTRAELAAHISRRPR